MTKKNLRPQQVAPVQRETTATSSQQGQMTPSFLILTILSGGMMLLLQATTPSNCHPILAHLK